MVTHYIKVKVIRSTTLTSPYNFLININKTIYTLSVLDSIG